MITRFDPSSEPLTREHLEERKRLALERHQELLDYREQLGREWLQIHDHAWRVQLEYVRGNSIEGFDLVELHQQSRQAFERYIDASVQLARAATQREWAEMELRDYDRLWEASSPS